MSRASKQDILVVNKEFGVCDYLQCAKLMGCAAPGARQLRAATSVDASRYSVPRLWRSNVSTLNSSPGQLPQPCIGLGACCRTINIYFRKTQLNRDTRHETRDKKILYDSVCDVMRFRRDIRLKSVVFNPCSYGQELAPATASYGLAGPDWHGGRTTRAYCSDYSLARITVQYLAPTTQLNSRHCTLY